MRKLLLVGVFILSLSFLSLVDQAVAQDSPAKRSEGLVIYRDRILEPPFKFTGIGEDTLRLNGIPYFPVRRYREEYRKWKEKRRKEEIELMKKMFPDSVVKERLTRAQMRKNSKPNMERIRKQHELSIFAYEEAKKAKFYEDKVKIYAKIIGESAIVDSIKILSDKRVKIYWEGESHPEYSTLPREDKPPLTKQERLDRRIRYHTNHVNDFWKTYNRGGTIVFGDIGGYLYSKRTEETLEAIDKLSRGDTLTAQEKEKSIFCGGGGRRILYLFKERFRREGKGRGENE